VYETTKAVITLLESLNLTVCEDDTRQWDPLRICWYVNREILGFHITYNIYENSKDTRVVIVFQNWSVCIYVDIPHTADLVNSYMNQLHRSLFHNFKLLTKGH
jgi:hypothetical protein